MRARTLAVALLLAASPAAAQERPAALVAEARALAGTGDTRGLTLLAWGVGAELRVAPTLRLRATALALTSVGRTADGRDARGGGGGEFALRLSPFPSWRVRPFALWSLGLLVFPRTPFLPGGDLYEGMLGFGAGVEVDLGDRVTLTAAGLYSHLSNGQGLGPHNPAFDGFGGAVNVGWSFGTVRTVSGAWGSEASTGTAREGWTPGVVADASIGSGGGALIAAGRARAFERVADHVLLGLDGASGVLAAEPFGEVGLFAATHWRHVSAGARVGYRRYAGVDTLALHAQLEAHLTAEVSVVAMGAFERSTVFGDLARAGVGLRAFPLRWLAFEMGVGFDRIGDAPFGDASDPYLGVEFQLPVGAPDWQLSLFLERQISTLDLIGLRFAWGVGANLRDVARRTGWRPLL